MADITLNLLYNDNGAKASIDSLYNELLKMEQRQWKINLGQIDTRYISQIEEAAKRFQNAYAMISAPNGTGLGRTRATFQELEQLVDHLNNKIKSNRLSMLDAWAAGDSDKVTKYKNAISDLTSELDRVQKAFDRIKTSSAANEFLKLKDNIAEMQKSLYATPEEIQKISQANALRTREATYRNLFDEAIKNLENLEKYGTKNVRHDDAVGRRVSAMLGLSPLPSSARTAVPQSPSGKYSRYLDYSGVNESLKEDERRRLDEYKEAIAKANNDISQGHHQTWRGIQQTITGVLHTITSAYNTFKAVVTAPLNLTGVSQVASMIQSMEGGLLLNQISSNIKQGFSMGLERFDVLQTFPKVMQSIGYSADQSNEAMNRLYNSVLGLPTAFSDIVDSAKYFALVLDDLDKATDLAIAANNAFVASGANSQQISAGMRQLQYLIDGTKLRSTQWYSLIRAMPIALREVGKAMGYVDFPSFTADLMGNKIATDDLIDTLIDVGLHSEKLGAIVDTMKSRVTAAMDNVRNAAMRMGDAWLEALDTSLQKTGGKGIAENIKGVSKIIDHIAQVGAEWINNNGDKLQALIDKFMKIDWSSIIPKLFDGLTEFADKALDNINKFIDKISGLITTVKQAFNDLENNPLVKFITGSGSVINGISQVAAGIANVVAGVKLTALGKSILANVGTVGASAAGAATGASAAGAATGAATATGVGGIIVGGASVGIAAIVAAVVEYMNNMEKRQEITKDTNRYLADNPYALSLVQQMNSASAYLRSPIDINQTFPQIYSSKEEARRKYKEAAEKLKQLYPGISFVDTANVTKDMRPDYYSEVLYDEEWVKKRIEENQVPISSLLASRANEDILRNEYESMSKGAEELYRQMEKLWDRYNAAAAQYTTKLSAIDATRSRLQATIEKLEKDGYKWTTYTTSSFAEIYGDPKGKEGKFFSEKVKESFGGLFRNTTNDFAQVQKDLGPKIFEYTNKMKLAIEDYDLPDAQKSELYEAWANVLSGFDPKDEASVKQFETMILEGPEKIIKTLLIPNIKANDAYNKNAQLIRDAMLEALGLAGGDLDKQTEEINEAMEKDGLLTSIVESLSQQADKLDDKYLGGIRKSLLKFGSDYYATIKKWVDTVNSWNFVAHPKIEIEPIKTTRALNDIGPQSGYYSATGGFMFAPHGTDTIPAMLTPGEYVQRRAAVEHFGRVFMDRINALDLRGALRSLQIATPYSTGGFIKNETRNYRDNHAVVNQTFNNSSMNYGMRRANRFVRALG